MRAKWAKYRAKEDKICGNAKKKKIGKFFGRMWTALANCSVGM